MAEPKAGAALQASTDHIEAEATTLRSSASTLKSHTANLSSSVESSGTSPDPQQFSSEPSATRELRSCLKSKSDLSSQMSFLKTPVPSSTLEEIGEPPVEEIMSEPDPDAPEPLSPPATPSQVRIANAVQVTQMPPEDRKSTKSTQSVMTARRGGRKKTVMNMISDVMSVAASQSEVEVRRVRIAEAALEGHEAVQVVKKRRRVRCSTIFFALISSLGHLWTKRLHQVTVFASLYELWSMGIWLGFLTEPDMSYTLRWILLFDAAANGIVVLDTLERLIRWSLEWHQRHNRFDEVISKTKQKTTKEHAAKVNAAFRAAEKAALRELATILPKLILALMMFPLQVILDKMLTTDTITETLVPVILVLRMSRVGWATMDSITFINRKEMDVYVEIRIQGSVGGQSSSWQVIMKQFLIVLFWAHWVGCFTYGLRALVKSQVWQKTIGGTRGIPRTADGARDYFQQFAARGKLVGYQTGKEFGTSYALALYRGVGWNFEDLVPERPEELLLELLTVACITAIRSYCVGSFFKYHSMREMEMQGFNELMESVNSYMDLCELPPSLRKAIIQHFGYQQEKRREVQTLEVLRNLPLEVQMDLREHEYLPLVADKNPLLFSEVSRDCCMQVCLLLESRFLQPGETVFLEGDAPREFMFLSEGSVALSRYTQTGGIGKAAETLICYLRSERKEDPSALGEAAFLLEKSHLYSCRVRAGMEAIVLYTPREVFQDKVAGPFADQYELLLRNMASAYLLGLHGDDVALIGKDKSVDQESEHFQGMREEVRDHLLTRRESLNAKFTYAASTGDADLVASILMKGVDPNTSDYDMRSALHLAASEGMTDTIKVILKNSGDANLKDRWGSTPLQDALKNGYLFAAKEIQSFGGSLGLDDPSGLLCSCASEGNTPKMQQLLEFNVDVNAGDYDMRTALHLSATEGQLTVVAFLVSHLANVNVKDRWNSTPLEDAIRNGFNTVAHHLRSHGGRVDGEFAANLLCDAASNGNLAQLQMLVENGVDANAGNYDMRTAVHLAAAEGQLLALNFLINVANANHSTLDRWQATPLQDALAGSHESCTHLLLVKGAALGPSASDEEIKKVQDIKDEWFAGDASLFRSSINSLRHKIASHGYLVQQGRARSDIFERDVAMQFNRLLLHRQIGYLQPFAKHAQQIVSALNRLESLAVRPMVHTLRLLVDAATLATEGSFWMNYNAHHARRESYGRKRKDARVSVFDHAMIGAMSIVPVITEIIDRGAATVIQAVDTLQEERHLSKSSVSVNEDDGDAPKNRSVGTICAHARPSAHLQAVRWARKVLNGDSERAPALSELVIDALFQIFGWDKDQETQQSGCDAFTMALQAFGSDYSKLRQKAIENLERLAADLLPVENLRSKMQHDIFQEWVFEDRRASIDGVGYNWSSTSGDDAALCRWLNKHFQVLAAGKVPQAVLSSDLKPHGQLSDAYKPLLRPSHLPARTTVHGTCTVQEPVEGESLGLRCAYRHLVVSELILLALVSLILKEWEKSEDGNSAKPVPEKGNGGGLLLSRETRGHNYTRMFSDLSTIFRTAASECLGKEFLTEGQKKQLLEAAREAARDAKRERKLAKKKKGPQAKEHTKQQTKEQENIESEEDSDEPDKEDELATVLHGKEIQMAKIWGLKGTMDPEELSLLLDFSDVFSGDSEIYQDGKCTLFGPISRSRFTANLLRWIVNQNERQKDILEEALVNGAYGHLQNHARNVMPSTLAAGAEQLHAPASDALIVEQLSSGIEVTLSSQDMELQEEVAALQDQASNDAVSGERDEVNLKVKSISTKQADADRQGHIHRMRSSEGQASAVPGLLQSMHGTWSEDGVFLRKGSTMTMQNIIRGSGRMAVLARRALMAIHAYFSGERHKLAQKRLIGRRFRELDEDGEGIGVVDVSQILGDVFHHTLGHEQELRAAHRMFELLEKDEIGELVILEEFLSALPQLENEVKEQQRKNMRRHNADTAGASLMKVFSWMVVAPDATWLYFWDTIKKTAVVYYMVAVPIRFCFVSFDHLDDWQKYTRIALDIFFDTFMVMNTILNFFRSFLHPTRGFVTHFQEIRVNYLVEFFFIDALACLPVDWFIPDTSNVSSGNRGLFTRPRAVAKLVRLLHLRHLIFKDNLSLETAAERRRRLISAGFMRTAWGLLKFIVAMIHFLTCFWWYLGSRWDDFDPKLRDAANATRSSWIYGYRAVHGEPSLGDEDGKTPFWWQYLIAFFWSAGRICAVGTYGELYPGSVSELLWCCVIFLLAFAVSGYVDGILAGKVMTSDDSVIQALATRRIVDDYLLTVDLPEELADRVRTTAGATAEAALSRSTEDVSNQMPHLLKQRIARRAFLPCFESSGSFKNCSHNFLVELGTQCKVVLASKGSLLASVGEPATKLLVLYRGRIAFLDRAGRTFLESGRTGEMIGDIELIFDIKYEIGARATEESKLICLDRSSFIDVCQRYAADRITLQRSVIDSVETVAGERGGAGGAAEAIGDTGSPKEGSDKDFDRKSMATSQTSASTEGSLTVGQLRHRVFMAELQKASEKTEAELNDAKQSSVCRFIDFAAQGNLKMVQSILQKNDVEVDEGDYDQRTALHLAVCEGRLDIVRYLIEEHGASLSVTDRFGNMPLDDGVREKRVEVSQYLVERNAGFKADFDMAGVLCQAGFDGDLDTLTLLLKIVGCNPNAADYDGRTGVHLGASMGHLQVVELLTSLTDLNVNVKDRFGNTPLDDAIRHQHRDVRLALQQKGGEMGDQHLGVTICTLGALNDVVRLKELSESGVPMSQGNYDARTGLHLAASEGHIESVAFLLNEAMVPPNPLDRFFCTPLDDAVRHERQAIESLIRERGGLSGGSVEMVQDVEEFKRLKAVENEKKDLSKLDRETKTTEIHMLSTGLAKFAEHPTFFDDIHTYVNHATNIRKVLFHLLRNDAINNDEGVSAQHVMSSLDKEKFEVVLDVAVKGLDATGTRLEYILENDLVPWVSGFTNAQAKLVKLFMPKLPQVVQRLRDHFKSRADLPQAIKKLWSEGSKSYQCAPLGLLTHRFLEQRDNILSKCRVDACAMLWITSKDDEATPDSESKPDESERREHRSVKGSVVSSQYEPLEASVALRMLSDANW